MASELYLECKTAVETNIYYQIASAGLYKSFNTRIPS